MEAEFKDPVSHISHMCLAGTLVASWSLTQDIAGSSFFNDNSSFFNDNYFSSLNSLNSVKRF